MCELLGLSFNMPVRPLISFKALRSRGAAHRHGWGIAFYPETNEDKGDHSLAAQIIKEEGPAFSSRLAGFVQEYEKLMSRVFIAHVRTMGRTKGANAVPAYRNTHPFCRELNGKEYVLAHNGTIRDVLSLKTGRFHPLGRTDSERFLCSILNYIEETQIGLNKEEDLNDLRCYIDKANRLKEDGAKSKLNVLLSDGETLVAYYDCFGGPHREDKTNTLYRLHRPAGYCRDGQVLEDGDYRIDFHVEKGREQAGYIIATERLTNEPGWVRFEPGELCAFRRGELVFSSTRGIEQEDVDVYAAPTWLIRLSNAPRVIGMPHVLRRKLGVELGDKVVVSKGARKEVLEVHQTDGALLNAGGYPARDPGRHVCLPKRMRESLALQRSEPRQERARFSTRYSAVSIQPYDDTGRRNGG